VFSVGRNETKGTVVRKTEASLGGAGKGQGIMETNYTDAAETQLPTFQGKRSFQRTTNMAHRMGKSHETHPKLVGSIVFSD